MFEIIRNKINFINFSLNNFLISQLNTTIENFFQNDAKNVNFLTPTLKEIIKLEFLYSLAKNYCWAHFSLLKEIWIDLLISEFNFTRDTATEFITTLVKVVNNNLSHHTVFSCITNEDEFLRYVLITAITCENLELLELELGLGKNFISKILNALKIFNKLIEQNTNSQKDYTAIFLNNIDEKIIYHTKELVTESQKDPKTLDLYKLKYILGSMCNEFELKLLNTLGVKWFFDLLLYIGQTHIASYSMLETIFSKSLEQYDLKNTSKPKNLLLNIMNVLQAKNLVFLEQTSINHKKNKWRLSSIAEKIIAHTYAKKFLEQENFDINSIKKMPTEYQKAILNFTTNKQTLAHIANYAHELACESIKILIEKILKMFDSQTAQQYIVNIFNKSTNTKIKEFICEIMENEPQQPTDYNRKSYNTMKNSTNQIIETST